MTDVIKTLFVVDGVLVMASYVPQWVKIWRSTTGAKDVSLLAWSYWTVSITIGTLYAQLVVKNAPLTFVVTGFLVCHVVTVVLLVLVRLTRV